MKIQVNIITGFLGSGKTTFINETLKRGLLSNKKTLVIQCEAGERELEDEIINHRTVIVKKFSKDKPLDSQLVKDIIKWHLPNRIIIEHNGMSKMEDLVTLLEDSDLIKLCKINQVINIIDANTFDLYINNMRPILTEQISISDSIILNNADGLPKGKFNNVQQTLKAINRTAEIIPMASHYQFKVAVDNGIMYFEKEKVFSGLSDKLMTVGLAIVSLYLIILVDHAVKSNAISFDISGVFPGVQTFSTIFLSILIQAFPFILFGVFVSSILQIFISEETIIRIFPRNQITSFLVAILAGFLFPVCDCAIVPVASRLVKKGVPLSAAITFMLAAPIVNPIVIASTLYAFPGKPVIAIFRVGLGIIIAIAVGALLMLFDNGNIVRNDGFENTSCQCGYCGTGNLKGSGVLGIIRGIFSHAGAEFFTVGKYLIMGAFLSSLMQMIIPQDVFSGIRGNVISLLIMMAAAFILSVCSTSDAFIARSFSRQFPMHSIMGFMVLGPMIDIKNLLMLLGNFKKGFVLRLLTILLPVAFIILYLSSLKL
ncbi:MAG: permease [Thermincola sp.]|jgi:uncharacterized membrane protein YraQ (UPF0718 family)/Ni2+-binding GTPase involved in maturation of urease and hydrogenase|nr:permease [Thermincola sp.]MDT3703127.1 permease [Thermincola sp.]